MSPRSSLLGAATSLQYSHSQHYPSCPSSALVLSLAIVKPLPRLHSLLQLPRANPVSYPTWLSIEWRPGRPQRQQPNSTHFIGDTFPPAPAPPPLVFPSLPALVARCTTRGIVNQDLGAGSRFQRSGAVRERQSQRENQIVWKRKEPDQTKAVMVLRKRAWNIRCVGLAGLGRR